MWQYYQTYYILRGEDYEDKYALLSTPTELGVGLITKTTVVKPRQSPPRLHNAFMMVGYILLCENFCQPHAESYYCRDWWDHWTVFSILCKESKVQTFSQAFFFFWFQQVFCVGLPG